jgi:hypothetical protein
MNWVLVRRCAQYADIRGGRAGRAGVSPRMLGPVAQLTVDDQDLVVRLTPSEKFWGFHGNLRIRLGTISMVAPDPDPWLGLRGRRMAGVHFQGYASMGTRLHGGHSYDFLILHRDQPAVRVEVATGRFSRLVIGVPPGSDPEAEAAKIAAAAGIALSAPVS